MICLKHNKEIIGVIGAKSLCEDCVSCEKDFERDESKMFFVVGIIAFIIILNICL